jgi:hypothetical protein
LESIAKCVKKRHLDIYQRAKKHSDWLIESCESAVDEFLVVNGIDPNTICFAVVGSVGRTEALSASDLDVVPVVRTSLDLELYSPHDKKIREMLRDKLGVKISKGEDLTKPISIEELIESDTIGGSRDTSAALTKRVLLMTESRQAGGKLEITDIRRQLLQAYSDENRTSGRHVLSLCNDIARYYKTLCVEYKAKIDEERKDWCTRNIKLRHSRKMWYFSNIISITLLADMHPQGENGFKEDLLGIFNLSPMERITNSIGAHQPLAVGRLLESYALFLEFMADEKNREALARVEHADRYNMSLDNAFPVMKFNSDLIQYEMMAIVEQLGSERRSRMMSWFLF